MNFALQMSPKFCYYDLAAPASICLGKLTEGQLKDSNSKALRVKSFVSWCRNFGTIESTARRFLFGGKMAEVKAIPTKYDGYEFRSRAEARWAVFFNSLDIRYEYEKEGMDLTEMALKDPNEYHKTGEYWYLPDFYLPEYHTFVEIKPWTARADGIEWTGYYKCLLLSSVARVLVVFGVPGDGSYYLHYLRSCFKDLTFVFAEGRKCDRLWVVNEETGRSYDVECDACWSPRCKEGQTWPHRGLEKAYEAARSARF